MQEVGLAICCALGVNGKSVLVWVGYSRAEISVSTVVERCSNRTITKRDWFACGKLVANDGSRWVASEKNRAEEQNHNKCLHCSELLPRNYQKKPPSLPFNRVVCWCSSRLSLKNLNSRTSWRNSIMLTQPINFLEPIMLIRRMAYIAPAC
jgi:hypothetical protein